MNRKTRLIALCCVLVVAVGVTVGVSLKKQQSEDIAESGEVVFEVPVDDVTALSWEYTDDDDNAVTLAFTDGDDGWTYDDDTAFPVDDEKIAELLDQFSAMQAAFVINDVTDYDQYGLEDPTCTIDITAGDTDYEILVGNYSELDYQRYISVGDGKVYLVNDDPMDYYKVTLDDLMLDDTIPNFVDVTRVEFSGAEDYTIERNEDGDSYRDDDVYYTDAGVLDTDSVNSYVTYISELELGDYYTYKATDDDLAACGLDDPELTVYIEYPDSETDETESFTIAFSRSAEDKLTDWDDVLAAMDAESDSAEATSEPTDDDAVAYMRVGDSSIIYEISYDNFKSIMACSYNDLRHTELFPAEFEDFASISVTLDDETYELTTTPPEDAEEDDEDTVPWYYDGKKIDIADVEAAVSGLSVSSFTDVPDLGETEISFTATLSLEGSPEVSVTLHRVDGERCYAEVDGEAIGYVPRSQVVDLIEAVNAIVLG